MYDYLDFTKKNDVRLGPVEEALVESSEFCNTNSVETVSRPLPNDFKHGDKGKLIWSKGKSSDMPHRMLKGKILFQEWLSKVRNNPEKTEEVKKQNNKTISASNGLRDSMQDKLSSLDCNMEFELLGLKNNDNFSSFILSDRPLVTISQYEHLINSVDVEQDFKDQLKSSFEEAVFLKAGIALEDKNKLMVASPVSKDASYVNFVNDSDQPINIEGRLDAAGKSVPLVLEKVEINGISEYYEISDDGVRGAKHDLPNGYRAEPILALGCPEISFSLKDNQINLELGAADIRKADIDRLSTAVSANIYNENERVKSPAERIQERADSILLGKARIKAEEIMKQNPIFVSQQKYRGLLNAKIHSIKSNFSQAEKQDAYKTAANELSHLYGIGNSTDIGLAIVGYQRAGGINSDLVTHESEVNNFDYPQDIDDHWVVETRNGDHFEIQGSNGPSDADKLENILEFYNQSNNTSDCILDLNVQEIDAYIQKLDHPDLIAKMQEAKRLITDFRPQQEQIDSLCEIDKSKLQVICSKKDNINARDVLYAKNCFDRANNGYKDFIKTYSDFKKSFSCRSKIDKVEAQALLDAGMSKEKVLAGSTINHINPHWGVSVEGGKFVKDEKLQKKLNHVKDLYKKEQDPAKKQRLHDIKVQIGLDAKGRGDIDRRSNEDFALFGMSQQEVMAIANSQDVFNDPDLNTKITSSMLAFEWQDTIFNSDEIAKMGLASSNKSFKPEISELCKKTNVGRLARVNTVRRFSEPLQEKPKVKNNKFKRRSFSGFKGFSLKNKRLNDSKEKSSESDHTSKTGLKK